MSKQLRVKDFFENQFKQFAIYDSEKSIASIIDGQKTTARKVLYTCAIRNNSEIKVAQLASSVAYETAYHHGEQGVCGVIVNLAQNFAGANNINFLEPEGQFGSRLSPVGAAPRYIFTKLTPSFRQIFKKEDDLILEHLEDEGQKIEPKYFLPILPTILINGSQGIGTGFASKVLSYNPNDLKKDILAILKNKTRKKLVPWFNKFQGEVTQGENEKQWIISGKLEIVNTTTIKITELPIGTYLDDIKDTLSKLQDKEIIKDYNDDSNEDQFNIEVICPRTTTALPIEKLYEHFKLISKESENITLWNANDKLQVFSNATEVVDYFVDFRLKKYEERRLALITLTEEQIFDIDEKIRFINFYLDNTQVFKNTRKKELIDLLSANDFINPESLLSMAIWSLTKDRIEDLENQLQNKLSYLDELNNDTAQNMYIKELEELKL
jgi:DNA topoisomerase-2